MLDTAGTFILSTASLIPPADGQCQCAAFGASSAASWRHHPLGAAADRGVRRPLQTASPTSRAPRHLLPQLASISSPLPPPSLLNPQSSSTLNRPAFLLAPHGARATLHSAASWFTPDPTTNTPESAERSSLTRQPQWRHNALAPFESPIRTRWSRFRGLAKRATRFGIPNSSFCLELQASVDRAECQEHQQQ